VFAILTLLRSKDQAIKPTADEVSDLGVCALQSSESEELDSGNEEVDWLASSPSRTRNKISRTDVVIIQSVLIITGMSKDLLICTGSLYWWQCLK
jgi:hypothetical protein